MKLGNHAFEPHSCLATTLAVLTVSDFQCCSLLLVTAQCSRLLALLSTVKAFCKYQYKINQLYYICTVDNATTTSADSHCHCSRQSSSGYSHTITKMISSTGNEFNLAIQGDNNFSNTPSDSKLNYQLPYNIYYKCQSFFFFRIHFLSSPEVAKRIDWIFLLLWTSLETNNGSES